ncbi:MAG: universal stress protein UspE [Gammaproteobacteria bacterium]|nr:universal stress protein UspE [Gammaproteobacteria bacterium]
MRRLDNILVVLDPQQEEQPALARAAYLAEASGASLHLFLCAYDASIGIATFLTGGQRDTFIQTIVDGSRVMVERLVAPYIDKGLVITFDVVWDRQPVEAVLQQCKEDEYDLLVKHAQHHGRAEAMFNHADWNLLRYSPCPVLLVKDGQWDEVGQVLAAVDAAPETELHRQLNRSILDLAKFLANVLDFELHLVSAYPPPPVFVPVSVAVETRVNYRSKMKAMVEQHVAELAGEYDVIDERVHAIEGPTDWAISSVSKDLVAEFVVMGNVSRPGLAGLSIGTSAEPTLDALETNVLLVKMSESAE